ncbi:MAG: hypothetical protein RMJ44_02930 [Cytophagales bacterium]|nr:hypothetical protein [Bernardetiaceae bacterium]MDW8210017.1 hypothetical protein [Cytophagales bacterium]
MRSIFFQRWLYGVGMGLFSSLCLQAQNDSTFLPRKQPIAQNRTEEPSRFIDRLRVGGNFSFQFGNVTFIDISPLVFYQVTPQLHAGTGVTYQYIRFNFRGFSSSSNSIYGGRVFGRFFPFVSSPFFAHAEYETLNVAFFDQLTGEVRRDWVPGTFLGGGYIQQLGQRAAFNLTILYNFSWNQFRSPYASPWVVRAGFHF